VQNFPVEINIASALARAAAKTTAAASVRGRDIDIIVKFLFGSRS
jgi:hypothetical protein